MVCKIYTDFHQKSGGALITKFQVLWRFFRYVAIGTSYVQDFFYWRQELHLDNLLDTHNIYFGRIENFLEGSEVTEVQFFIKKQLFGTHFDFKKTPSISHFFQSFSRFVQYISIGAFWTLLRFIAVKN